MATIEFYPTITPVPLKDVPSTEEVVKAMVSLIVESESWSAGKTFDEAGHDVKVHTFSRNKTGQDRAMWHGRESVHPKEVGGFDAFWQGIGVNHSENEKEYFHELTDVKLVKKLSDSQEIWSLYYSLRPPAADRVFTILVTTHTETEETTGLRAGYVMSIPVDVTSDADLTALEFKATRGFYASVERVHELDDGGVNWRMITTSTPGGYIPQFIVERTIPGKIKEDVPAYLDWLTKRKEAAANTSA